MLVNSMICSITARSASRTTEYIRSHGRCVAPGECGQGAPRGRSQHCERGLLERTAEPGQVPVRREPGIHSACALDRARCL
jgi:hypothetical protein